MFANPTFVVGTLQRVVAILVACAVTLWSVGVYTTAQAANLINISDTVSTSDPGVAASHSIAFTIPAGSALVDGDTVTIDFSDGPFGGVATVLTGDVTVTVNGTPDPHAGFAAGATTISFNSVTAAAGQEVIVAIADGKITNPAGSGVSYEIIVDTGTGGDTGKTRVAIVDTVLVTAIVNTSFDFTVSGMATSSAVNGTTTTGSTTPTTIPFGEIVAGGVYTMAQKLNVSTNAYNGYVVTVEQDGNLRSSTGADIDGFRDGAYTDTPEAWGASPLNTLGQENTYGHWGLTSTDGDLQGAGTDFGAADTWISASTTPRAIMAHNSVSNGADANADSTGDDTGETIVGYQLEITPLQEAADDYQTTLTYIATPTF